MVIDRRKNLMKYAEEAAYSSKGHLKSADWVSLSLKVYVTLPILASIILLCWQNMPIWLERTLNCIAFTFSTLALTSPLVSNQNQASQTIEDHMTLGNEYLDVYKEIRDMVSNGIITDEQSNQISSKMRTLDQRTNKLRISGAARCWSRCVINKEMDLDWIEK